MATTAPYGSWASPISADLIVGETIGLGAPALDGAYAYWTEARPAEAGRVVLVRCRVDDASATPEDVTPAPYNVRSRVHEYGGGAFLVDGGRIWFVNFADQRIYGHAPGEPPTPVTAAGDWRFADLCFNRRRNRLIAVREDHGAPGEPKNEVVAVALEDGAVSVLAGGHDFVAAPRLDVAGGRLAWLAWDHPNMPWDGTELRLADLDGAGQPAAARVVAGGPAESIFQPEFSANGALHFVSDRTGWWNLYRAGPDGDQALCTMAAEFGQPQWVFAMSSYALDGDGRPVAAWTRDGLWQLGAIEAGAATAFVLPYDAVSGVCAAAGKVLFLGAAPDRDAAVVLYDRAGGRHRVLRRAASAALDASYIARPRPLSYPTSDGATAHAFYYAPTNRDFAAPPGTRPPLMVRGHGGPTGASSPALNLQIQYWASHGFAVLDLNYRGSTGYGRPYREALYGNWGVADVDDAVAGARHLVAEGLADADRLAIRGGSAGGYTALAALAFRDTFSAGASHYGIGDLAALAADTHKFESRYLDRLVGPLPAAAAIYRARSPLHHTAGLDCPVIFLQGLDDRIVPPNQAEAMVAALQAKGLPVAYLAFAGEGHGFRKAENVKRALEAELYFYGRVFDFMPADAIEPVDIANLADAR